MTKDKKNLTKIFTNLMLSMPETVFLEFIRVYCTEHFSDEQLTQLNPILDDFDSLVKSWDIL